jgi:hypothetical protein
MFSRVDDPLYVSNGQIEICGPIRWENGEQNADFGFIFRQGAVLIVGSTSASNAATPAKADKEWMGGKFPATNIKKGQGQLATVTVVSIVHRTTAHRPIVSASWVQQVEIADAP